MIKIIKIKNQDGYCNVCQNSKETFVGPALEVVLPLLDCEPHPVKVSIATKGII